MSDGNDNPAGKSDSVEWVVRSHKKIMYNVDKVGTIIEEVKVSTKKQQDGNQGNENEALLSIYINQELVRQKNLITGEMIMSNPKYEPYEFLRGISYGPIPELEGGPYVPISSLIDEIKKQSKTG